MSAIHRVDDIRSVPAARFFRLAHRLTAYRGVMRERALAAQREEPQRQAPRPPRQAPAPAQAQARQGPGYREVPGTRTALQNDAAFKGIFSFGSAGSG